MTDNSNGAPQAERITIEHDGKPVEVERPGTQSNGQSIFLVSLPKAGSTLFYRVMEPCAKAAGLTYFSIAEIMRSLGIRPRDFSESLNRLYAPNGYAFGGYRSLPGKLDVPTYASGRTVFLARDPRDMLTSLYFSVAKSHRAPGQAVSTNVLEDFSSRREQALAMDIDTFALENARTVRGQFKQTLDKLDRISFKSYRYEDIVFSKRSWLEEMLDYLSLDVPAKVVDETLAEHDVVPTSENTSEHIRKVKPGDHVDKLKPATIEELNELFAPMLRRFDYK